MPNISLHIRKLITSEKSNALKSSLNRYIFLVDRKFSSSSAVKEIQKLYKVDVLKVTSSILPGKKKRVGKTNKNTKLPVYKKIFVTLKDGQKIEVEKQEKKKEEKREDKDKK